MNTKLIAAALHALADAIGSDDTAADPIPATTSAESQGGAVKRGRPSKAAAAPSVVADPMALATSVPAQGQTQVIPAQVPGAPTNGGEVLTHAAVAPDFTAAGRAHGRDFVKDLMEKFGAPTYDKVPKESLAKFRDALKAGPQPKADPNSVEDLMA